MGKKLYVGNLDYQTTAEDLVNLFGGAGTVRGVQLITDRDTQASKGFAFVEMETEAEALHAISLYNGTALNDRTMMVSEARPREAHKDGVKGTHMPNRPKFREVKHKVRGGRKARNY